jgi:hypothetical protein
LFQSVSSVVGAVFAEPAVIEVPVKAPTTVNVPTPGAGGAQSKAVKRDILGFFPGMSKEEFDAREAQCLQGDGCGFATGSQSSQWGGVRRTLTEKLDRNLVKEVEFRFSSGTPPQEMIASISDQYGTNPVKPNWSAEIRSATIGHECPGRLPQTLSDLACVGGLIAEWRLDESLHLILKLNKPAAGGRPNEYYLILSSRALAALEEQPEKDRRREQDNRLRAINPQQRF